MSAWALTCEGKCELEGKEGVGIGQFPDNCASEHDPRPQSLPKLYAWFVLERFLGDFYCELNLDHKKLLGGIAYRCNWKIFRIPEIQQSYSMRIWTILRISVYDEDLGKSVHLIILLSTSNLWILQESNHNQKSTSSPEATSRRRWRALFLTRRALGGSLIPSNQVRVSTGANPLISLTIQACVARKASCPALAFSLGLGL